MKTYLLALALSLLPAAAQACEFHGAGGHPLGYGFGGYGPIYGSQSDMPAQSGAETSDAKPTTTVTVDQARSMFLARHSKLAERLARPEPDGARQKSDGLKSNP